MNNSKHSNRGGVHLRGCAQWLRHGNLILRFVVAFAMAFSLTVTTVTAGAAAEGSAESASVTASEASVNENAGEEETIEEENSEDSSSADEESGDAVTEGSAGEGDDGPVVNADASESEAVTEEEKQIGEEVLTADGRKYRITITYDESANIPEDSALHVTEIKSGTKEYKGYLGKTVKALRLLNNDSVAFARFFDIEIHDANGNEIEPGAEVSVKIELSDLPQEAENEPEVVHFEKDGPVVMESETVDKTDICFKTESFSAYGVITTQLPDSADDLDGWTVTLDRGGRYVTSNVLYNVGDPFRLGKTSNQSDAATWTFERSGEGYGYTFYNISTTVNGQKRYLHMGPVWYNNNIAHTTLETPDSASGCPQNFAVEKNSDGTYTIFIVLPEQGWIRLNLNEWDGAGGNGFAGYGAQDSNDHLNMTFQTDQPVLNERGTGKYAVIVKDTENDKYYAVQEDGSLAEVEYDESTGKARVKIEEPFVWTYTSVWDGLSDDTRSYNAGDDHPDWEPYNIRSTADARGYNEGTQLKDGDYFQYLSPGSDSGKDSEDSNSPSHDSHKWSNSIRYEDNHIHGIVWNGSDFDNTGQYIGADFENLKITGNQSAANAATVFLAVIENVPDPTADSETVTHIDIGIIAKAHLEAPLAYGTYYDAEGNPILKVSPDDDVTLELIQDVDIDQDDIRNSKLTARNAEGEEIDDAYYISGYSANEHTEHSAVQVRMEGSFKVTTLDPYSGPLDRSNDDANRKAERLNEDNQITYEVTTNKEIDFPLIYCTEVSNPEGNPAENGYYEYVNTGEMKGYTKTADTSVDPDKTYYKGQQLYGLNNEPLSVKTNADISASFGYWDKNNECPPLQSDFEQKYPYLIPDGAEGNYGRNNKQWEAGAIINNDFNTNYLPYGCPPYPGDSGMDFILKANVVLKDRILAVEVVKNIVDSEGKNIIPADDVDNKISIYYNEDASQEKVDGVGEGYAVPPNEVKDSDELLISKQENYEVVDDFTLTVPGGKEAGGKAEYYDYDVQPGMFYVKEDSDSVPETITDTDGKKWIYKETRVETEYVWRDDDFTDKRHVVEGYSGVPEVLGEYKVNGEAHRNGFLEFHVYNVYEVKEYPVYLKKVDENDTDTVLSGAEFDVYGPFEAEPDNPKQKDKKIGSIKTDEKGMAKVGDFSIPGLYYLYETKAPEGYELSSDPVIVTVTADADNPKGDFTISVSGANVKGEMSSSDEGDAISYQFTVANKPEKPDEPVVPGVPEGGTDDGSSSDENPGTGDSMPLLLLILLLITAAALAGGLWKYRRQEQ